MNENADASPAIFKPPPGNWRQPPGQPHTTWMKNIHDDLSPLDLGIHEAKDMVQNQPLCKLMSACYYWNTHTHPFNGPFSRTTWVSQYQKGKTNLDFTEARDSEWQWHQLGHMQVCISLQTDNHASTPPIKFFTGRMPFLAPNQQRQSTEGNNYWNSDKLKISANLTEIQQAVQS